MEFLKSSLYKKSETKAYYRLENNADDSKNSHDGSETNVSYVDGMFGKGISLNANGYIAITNHADLRPTGAFSVGCWMKSNQAPSGDYGTLFSSFYYSGGTLKGFYLAFRSNKGSFTISPTGTGDLKTVYSNVNINDNEWHLVVGVWDTSKMYIYIDDSDSANTNMATAPTYSATNYVKIGARGNTDNYYKGLIDDAFLINGYAMTASDVIGLYRYGPTRGGGSRRLTHDILNLGKNGR